jgi:hypothetical protein
MRLAILLLAALPVLANTTVTGIITVPTGELVSGSCSLQALGPFTSGAYRIVGAPVVVPFTAGAFAAALTPTDSATPAGQYYKTSCQVPAQRVAGRSIGPYTWGPKYWIVPTSATALDISQVEVVAPPPANVAPWVIPPGASWDRLAITWDSL